jgi:hypothetical protein
MESGLALALVLGMTAMWALAEDGKSIPVNKIPKKVLEGVKTEYPKAKIQDTMEVVNDKKETLYTFDLEQGEGDKKATWGATFSSAGKLIETMEPVIVADIPKPIMTALEKKYPLNKAPLADKVTEYDGKATKVSYSLRIAQRIRFSPTGKIINEEELVLTDDEDGDSK